jgi:acyl carrier protein
MTKQEFLLLIDELLEEAPGTLSGTERLQELEMWDSMTALGFIALLDEKFNVIVSGDDLSNCKTVNDLIQLANGQVTL